MSVGVLNLLMLAGLAGLAIPPLIHLLSRRRYDVVDWGAMQFLQVSETTRRRLLIEQLLLMLLRMGLIALLVLALASPYAISPVLDRFGQRENRDVVLIFDGSTSMGFIGKGPSPQEAAQEWANQFLGELAPGDSVAVLQARLQVIPIVGAPTHDLERVRTAIRELPPPRGSCDLPQAVQTAHELLQASHRPRREIVILSDGQQFGWADAHTLQRWQLLARQLGEGSEMRPHVWVVDLGGDRPAHPPNWSLGRLRAGRALASTTVSFDTGLTIHGQPYEPPQRIRLEVDGRPARDLAPPAVERLRDGQVPLPFRHAFATPGPHLVSVVVEPDRPADQRPADYVLRDHLPGDNRQDCALWVPTVPVLLVDGGMRRKGPMAGADFLRAALAPQGDKASVVRTRVVLVSEFQPELLSQPLGTGPDTRPRVLMLCNVAQLTPEQEQAVERFVREGGRVLVTLGPRVDRDHYNNQLQRKGQGWLPVQLVEPSGDENEPVPADAGTPDPAPHPLPSSFSHPALELFHTDAAAGLGKARFPRWWKVLPGPGAVTIARLTNNEPFLVEKRFGKGSVLVACVPLDDGWGTNLHRDVAEFPLLVHELAYYLAGARANEYNLVPGQPLQYQPFDEEPFGALVVQPPYGASHSVQVEQWPFVYTDTRAPGVYRLSTPGGRTVYYAVQPDTRDGDDLTPCTEEERAAVAKVLPMTYTNEGADILAGPSEPRELWWWLLVGVVVLLCGEVWFTRRLVRRQQG